MRLLLPKQIIPEFLPGLWQVVLEYVFMEQLFECIRESSDLVRQFELNLGDSDQHLYEFISTELFVRIFIVFFSLIICAYKHNVQCSEGKVLVDEFGFVGKVSEVNYTN